MQKEPGALVIGVLLLLFLSTLASLICDRVQASAEAGIATSLRQDITERLRVMSFRQLQALPVGRLVVSAQRHPEALAGLVIGHRLASMMMAVGPLAAAIALFLVSWQAALLVLGLSPVMILFFVLVGDAIRKRADMQEKAFGRLADQFEDRIRTLPTILANHAFGIEEGKLLGRLRAYTVRTMGVLRIAFLNAAVIDFFASLSIAMLAIFLGLGHLKLITFPGFSGLELWQSLFILMIAPEYFAPFRRFAEQYHAKAEGMAGAAALDQLLEGEAGGPALPAGLERLARLDLPERGLVAILGPSGSGKTTLLRRIAGLDPSHRPGVGTPVSWIGVDAYVPQGSLAAAIVWKTGNVDERRLKPAAEKVGLLDDALLPGGLATEIAQGGGNLSGGQRLRIAIARAMLTDRVVIADEPTAKLDAATAALIRDALRAMAASRLVVVATHDPALAEHADRTIDLADPDISEAA
jgi:ATP-binding cassette subfamily C protein